MKFRPTFSIRDLLWLSLVTALAVVAWIDRTDRQRLAKENDTLQKKIKADEEEFALKVLRASRARPATIMFQPDVEYDGFPGGQSFGEFGRPRQDVPLPNADEEQLPRAVKLGP